MQLKSKLIKYLVGSSELQFDSKPLPPYSPIACEFLNALSQEILKDKTAKKYSDIVSFAFWCRKGNIQNLKEQYSENLLRLGRGMAFHITPSNVPINFAFSFAFSLLAGNSNIVRVPSNEFVQINIVSNIINKLFNEIRFKKIADMTAFIKYEHNDEITSEISSQCAARIIWGGDNTINEIRKFTIPERSIDVTFADRYSFCVIDAKRINDSSGIEIRKLADNFYNDTYLMDQNACSSPKLIVWLGENKYVNQAKHKFWSNVYDIVSKKYNLQPVFVMDKYTQLCQNAIDLNFVESYSNYGNHVYCINLSNIPFDIYNLRGNFGYFYEYDTNDINEIAHIVNTKYQTLTYFGVDKSELVKFVLTNSLLGIDRIVPIGSALDISVIWDGYDLIRELSRVIDLR